MHEQTWKLTHSTTICELRGSNIYSHVRLLSINVEIANYSPTKIQTLLIKTQTHTHGFTILAIQHDQYVSYKNKQKKNPIRIGCTYIGEQVHLAG
jgi:hypothetical protein